MSNSYNKPRSCTSRLFGTLFAFIAAAAVVYVASYLVVFHITGLPAANQSGWLGPKLRFLATGPYEDSEGGSFYKGDTKPYDVFKPVNKLWLQTKDLPTTVPVAKAPEPVSAAGDERGARRGRSDSSAAVRDGNERLDDGSSTGTRSRFDSTTGTEEDRPRRRGRRGPGMGEGATTGTVEESTSPGESEEGERPRSRSGRPPQSAPE